MSETLLKAVDKVEILTLQDNYIEMTAMDNNAIVTRATPLKDGEIRASILAEHGFSALIKTTVEDKTHTLLFDFGFSADGAAKNAAALGIELTSVEAVVLSHGHSDHTGGIEQIAELIRGRNIPFVVHPAAFKSPRYLKYSEEIRAYFPRLDRNRIITAGFAIIETSKPRLLLDDSVLFLGEIPRRTDFEKGFPIARWQKDGAEIPDAIEDDTAVVFNLKNKGLLILSGCSHAGIVNTALYAREVTGIDHFHVVMGGFHLSGMSFEHIIDRTALELEKLNPTYVVPTHCTGRKAIMALEKKMPEKFILNMSGTKLMFT